MNPIARVYRTQIALRAALRLTAVTITLCSTVAFSNSWSVCGDGSGDFSTIQSAINNSSVSDGDTLFICPGDYSENISVTKDLYIIGDDSSTVIVSAANPSQPVFFLRSDFTELAGMTISGATNDEGIFFNSSSRDGSAIIRNNIIKDHKQGIEFTNIDGDVSITNNVFGDHGEFGIRILGVHGTSASLTIANNSLDLGQISSKKYGIYAKYFPKVQVLSNSIDLVRSNATLFYFEYLDSLFINGNSTSSDVYRSIYSRYVYEYISITNNDMPSSDIGYFQNKGNSNVDIYLDSNDFSGAHQRALYINKADDVTILNNKLEATPAIIQSYHNVIVAWYYSNLTFTGNTYGPNNINKYAFYAKGGKNAQINDNTQIGVSYFGFYFKNLTADVTVRNNSADSSKYGIYQYGTISTTDYTIEGNDFSDCTVYGMYLNRGDTVSIDSNNVTAPISGVQSGGSICVKRSNKITIDDNTCGTNKSDRRAIYLKYGIDASISNNTINSGNHTGIALYYFTGRIQITGNHAPGSVQYGCLIYNNYKNSDIVIHQNDFSESSVYGLYVYRADSVTITHTAAHARIGESLSGRSIYVKDIQSYVEIANDTVGTRSLISGDYAVKVDYSPKVVIKDNVVVSPNDIVFYISGYNLNHLEVLRNYATDFRYGLYNASGSSGRKVIVKQNLFASGSQRGIHVSGADSLICINNTLSECNKGLYYRYTDARIENNIITENSFGIYRSGSGGYTLAYNNVWNNSNDYHNCMAGETDISENPQYVDPVNDDYHLKSIKGSYHGGAWTPDDEDSPSLDAGDPNDDYSYEPLPNGNRINMGAYGNTVQASKAASTGLPVTLEYDPFPRKKWVLWGVPLTPEDPDPYAVVGDDFGNQVPTGNNWRTARWVTADEGYAYYGEDGEEDEYALPGQEPPDFTPGLGFWIIQDVFDSVTIDVTGNTLPPSIPDTVTLDPPAAEDQTGYNLMANPYNELFDWSTAQVTDGSETKSILDAASANWLSAYAITWNYESEEYEVISPNESSDEDTIRIWEGFWINQLDHAKNLELIYPYPPASKLEAPRLPFVDLYGRKLPAGRGKYRDTFIDWLLDLQLVTNDGQYRDVFNRIGVSTATLDTRDGLDADFFMPNASNFGALYFPHDDWTPAANLDYDYRSNEWDEQLWEFIVLDKNVNGNWNLRWPNVSNVPGTILLSLTDADTSEVLVEDLRLLRSYQFSLQDADSTRFTIKAVTIEDTIPPTGTAGFVQNPVIDKYVDLYVFPNEPLDPVGLDVFVDEFIQSAEFSAGNYNVYRSSFTVEEAGDKVIIFSMEDIEGNIGEDTLTMNFQMSGTISELIAPDRKMEISQFLNSSRNKQEFVGLGYGLNYSEHELPAVMIGDIYTPYLPPFKSGESLQALFHLPLFKLDRDEYEGVSMYQETTEGWKPIGGQIDAELGTLSGTIFKSGRLALFRIGGNSSSQPPLPDRTSLLPSYPNPFNAQTVIPYNIQRDTRVKLIVYDLLGREIATLINEFIPAGRYTMTWYGNNKYGKPVASGMYIFYFEADRITQIRKVTLLK